MKMKAPLAGMSPETFLAEYWQKKPLLIRNAFPDYETDITPEELAGLSCDTDAPSRIIAERGLDYPWQVKHGPFDEEDFTSLHDTHWTLLVNDLERYYPELQAEILDHFRFIPDWRIDDLMLSYAPSQGSVGAHTDEYDVFLLQVAGQRHWKITEDQSFIRDDNFVEEIELKILKSFEHTQAWTLKPGDMLYLPPNVIHHGVSLDDECMTFSIGFRAPDQKSLVQMYLEACLNDLTSNQRYQDPDLRLQSASGEIKRDHLDRLSAMIKHALITDQDKIDRWLGEYLTEIKGDVDTALVEDNNAVTQPNYKAHQDYQRTPGTRFAYIKQANGITFFVNGTSQYLDSQLAEAIDYLCSYYDYLAEDLESHSRRQGFLEVFEGLLGMDAIQRND